MWFYGRKPRKREAGLQKLQDESINVETQHMLWSMDWRGVFCWSSSSDGMHSIISCKVSFEDIMVLLTFHRNDISPVFCYLQWMPNIRVTKGRWSYASYWLRRCVCSCCYVSKHQATYSQKKFQRIQSVTIVAIFFTCIRQLEAGLYVLYSFVSMYILLL